MSQWSNSDIPQGALYIGQKYERQTSLAFTGRITSFNMWQGYLTDSEVALFAQTCRKEQGSLFQWVNLKDKVKGQLKVVEPSSCEYYVVT